MTERIRVLVVDDSAFMRNALSREISSDPRFIVVGTACDGREGVEKALDLQPDVITLDVEMPVQGGLDCPATARDEILRSSYYAQLSNRGGSKNNAGSLVARRD